MLDGAVVAERDDFRVAPARGSSRKRARKAWPTLPVTPGDEKLHGLVSGWLLNSANMSD